MKVSIDGGCRTQSRLAEMWRHRKFCDIVVRAGGRLFEAHRLVLIAGSDYLAALSESNFADSSQPTIDLSDLSADAFEVVLAYLYDGRCACEEALLTEVGAAASFLQVSPLLDKVGSALAATLSKSNAISLWSYAERYSVLSLDAPCKGFIAAHFGDLCRELALLSDSAIRALLSSNHMMAASEEQVFEATLSHVKELPVCPSDEELASLFALVRFPHMAKAYFFEHAMRESLLQGPACRDMLLRAFAEAAYGGHPRVRCAWVSWAHEVYRVMPDDDEPTPFGQTVHQSGEPFAVPDGWRIVSEGDTNFAEVLEHVVKPFSWSTDVLCVERGEGFKGFWCHPSAGCVSDTIEPGEPYDDSVDLKRVEHTGAKWLQFDGCSYRLLITRA